MQLPVMGTPEEAKRFLNYLNKRVSGGTLNDVKAATNDEKLIDSRKVTAYLYWNLVCKDGEKYKLTSLGRRLANAVDPEEERSVFREVLKTNKEYYGLVEMFYFNEALTTISNVEAAAYWVNNVKFNMSEENENTMKDRAVCFFKVCEAAGLGKYFLGRKGKATRLELNRNSINELIDEKSFEVTADEEETIIQDEQTEKKSTEINSNIISTESAVSKETIPLVISFKDGRQATLNMPKNASDKDAKYVYDMLKLMLSSQYCLKNDNSDTN